MGLADFFSIKKKEKTPFRTPKEIAALRARIDTENRENYPNLARYKELQREAELAYRILSDMIDAKLHAEDAIRVREDIKKKMTALGEKITKNLQDGKKDVKDDYVENTMDYLQRKSFRNEAKTLFTEFLLLIEEITAFCKTGRFEQKRTIDAATMALNKIITDLNNNFFKKHGEDKEIRALKQDMQTRVAELRTVFEQNRAVLREKGLDVRTASNILTMLEAMKE